MVGDLIQSAKFWEWAVALVTLGNPCERDSKMNRKFLTLLGTVAILRCSCFGEVQVTTEQVNPADPAWNFKTIPRPSRSDLALGATITFLGNQPEAAAGEPEVLLNGVLPADSLDLSEEALFSNGNPAGGQILIDLGRAQPIAAVATYSWHEWDVDGGARAPQVYTLYASAAAVPDPKDLGAWIKVASVDTRPNRTGEDLPSGPVALRLFRYVRQRLAMD